MSLLSEVDVKFFKLNRSMNSKWAICVLCHYCFQWAIYVYYDTLCQL